ncbi:uncharacterized protein LOC129566079 [Sitodiplosis mosellana]|uniref:uncharacterized protein LOC129566079 n=1 Tax=Sitodiplosis mosellana TaxID=263140 RepID=UPI002443FF27|nr:uncharacterized protein LOC129566079 [Sitodiplosis mosellana]
MKSQFSSIFSVLIIISAAFIASLEGENDVPEKYYERCDKYYGECKPQCTNEEELNINCMEDPEYKCCVKKPPGIELCVKYGGRCRDKCNDDEYRFDIVSCSQKKQKCCLKKNITQ